MARAPRSAADIEPAAPLAGSGVSALSWAAVIGGTVTAIAVTLTLLALGSAFGLATISPWPGLGAKPTSFTIGAGIWLVVTQWLSAGLGGYIAGRLRVRWTGLHTDEVFFRDTAHGFIAWAFATVISASVLGAAATHVLGGAASGIGAAAGQAAQAVNPAGLY